MKTRLFLIVIFTICQFSLLANSSDTTKITAKPLFLIYSNFHQGITESAHESNFDVKRAYLGYDFNLNNGFYAEIKIDIGSPDDNSQYSLIRRSAYFKNVGIGYTTKKLNIKFGIVDNLQHKQQEKFWGKRYVFKTYLDEYKFFPSADLGITAVYKINKFLSLEASMMNGEYLSNETGLMKYIYNFGFNISPNDKVFLKAFTSYTGKTTDIITSGIFLGIKPIKGFSLGGEYNLKNDIRSDDSYLTYGYSIYSRYDINNKLNVFARYDNLNSNIPEAYSTPWNLSKNGSAIIGGVEYKINENIKLALNYQDWYPMAANMANTAYIYFNLEFGIFESYKRI